MRKFALFILLAIWLAAGHQSVPVHAQDVLPPEAFAAEDGQFITVEGADGVSADLYVIDRGEQDNPAVLLLHGFGGSTWTWRDNIDVLVDAGYRVVAFDRPPYGLADKNPELVYTLENYAAYTAALMDELGIESAALVGHSAGGEVIAAFALEFPERVDALVFVAGAVVVGDVSIRDEDQQDGGSTFDSLFDVVSQIDPSSPLASVLVGRLVTEEFISDIAYANYYKPEAVPQEVIDGYTQFLRVEGWQGAFLNLLTVPESATEYEFSELAGMDVPVLIQWGEHDMTVPKRVGDALHNLLEGAQYIVYAESAHMPMEEETAAFNADLIAFLDTVYGG